MNKRLYDEISAYIPYDEKEAQDKEVMLKYIEQNEDVLTRNNEIAHFTTSAWITNKTRDKILMIYHNIYDSWAWVGGHADGDEDLLHVAKKETEEETGVTNLIPIKEGIYGLNIITVDNVELQIKEDENSGVKWIPIDEINNYSKELKMHPIYERLSKKLKEL